MTASTPVRETRDVLIQRAQAAMRSAEAETLPHRARIHIAAAETWLRLAARKPVGDSLAPSTPSAIPNAAQ